MLARKPKPTETAIQSVDDRPEVRAALDRLYGVRERRQRAEIKLVDLTAEKRERPGPGAHASDIRKILDGSAPPALVDRSAEIGAVEQEVRWYARAEEAAKHEVTEAQAAANREALDLARPEYAEIIRRTAAAVKALAQIDDEHQAFLDKLSAAGVSAGQLPVCRRPLGGLKADGSRANLWLADAAKDYNLE